MSLKKYYERQDEILANLNDRGVVAVPTPVRCDAHPRRGVHGLTAECFQARWSGEDAVPQKPRFSRGAFVEGVVTAASAATLGVVGLLVHLGVLR